MSSSPTPIFAGVDKSHSEYLKRADVWDWLATYWDFKSAKDVRGTIKKMREGSPEESYFLLDSGAFTAWNMGVRISLWDYIEFVLEYGDLFSHIVCLDVIDSPIPSEVHHRVMRKMGCENVIPVVHSGEPMHVLNRLIGWGYPYIGISPNNAWTNKSKLVWLRKIGSWFDFTNTKTHAFGFGSLSYMAEAPFITTFDTTTWIMVAAVGNIVGSDGSILGVSRKKDTPTDPAALCNLPAQVRDGVVEVCQNMGFTIEDLAEHHGYRKSFNAYMLSQITDSIRPVQPSDVMLSLFEGPKSVEDYGHLQQEERLKGRFTESFLDQQAENLIATRGELDYSIGEGAKTGSARGIRKRK